jgi:Uma2 family endonuclease
MTMPAPVSETLLTVEEFARTIDPPGVRTELVRGMVVTMPPAKTKHGFRAGRINRRLDEFVERHELGITTGEGGYILAHNPDSVRGPDAAFISAARIPEGGLPEDEYFEGAPDLAVEVISPSETDENVATKVAEYLAAGAQRVWEVRPRLRTVTVHRPGRAPETLRHGDALTSQHACFSVEGFELRLEDLFA